MAHPTITRRHWLALAAAAAAGPALAAGAAGTSGASGASDHSARVRPLAAHGNCLDITLAGTRLVAVGERGHVLLSDDNGVAWRQAAAVPTRNTLTCVHATDARRLWAGGHGGTLLRSDDAGEHWQAVGDPADAKEVLLSVRVETDGRGLAVGGFGHALATRDGGARWQPQTLVDGEAGERHLNRIFRSAAGSWLIAAEGGHILRRDDGNNDGDNAWQAVRTPYAGSLWAGCALDAGVLLACGMRGNVVRSSDDGRSWTHTAVADAGSLTAVVPRGNGRATLVGVDGTLVDTLDNGASFRFRRLDERVTLTGAVLLASGALAVSSATGMRILAAGG